MTITRRITKSEYTRFIMRTKRVTRTAEHTVRNELTNCGWEIKDLGEVVVLQQPQISICGKRRTHKAATEILESIIAEQKEPVQEPEIVQEPKIVQEETTPQIGWVNSALGWWQKQPEPIPEPDPEPETSIKAEIIQLPISQDQIIDIVALKNNQGILMTVVSKMCDVLDVGTNNQIEKIRERDDWLSADIRFQLPGDAQSRRVFCIAVENLEAWLNSINRNKVSERARPALVKLQAECTKAIRNWFHPPPPPPPTETTHETLLMAILGEMREDRKLILKLIERIALVTPPPMPMADMENVIIDAARTAAEVAINVSEVITPGVRFIRPGVYDFKGLPAYTSWKAIEIATQRLNVILGAVSPDLPSLEHYFEKYGYDLGKLTASRLNQLASIRKAINRSEMPIELVHLQDRNAAAKENRLWSNVHITLLLPILELWCGLGCPEHGHPDDRGRWMWDTKLAIKKLTRIGTDPKKYGYETIGKMVEGVTTYARMMT
jgi:hypothetical protein